MVRDHGASRLLQVQVTVDENARRRGTVQREDRVSAGLISHGQQQTVHLTLVEELDVRGVQSRIIDRVGQQH
jgi:hypothetical protein